MNPNSKEIPNLLEARPLPTPTSSGDIETRSARIWYSIYGKGNPLILLHGGLGNSENWVYLIEPLTNAGYQVILMDTRGHGRSLNYEETYSYVHMAEDVKRVLEFLNIDKAGFVGWSDGAVTSLILAGQYSDIVTGVFYFACNMDDRGALEEPNFNTQVISIFGRHRGDYERLNTSDTSFDDFVEKVSDMQKSEPNYTVSDLKRITKRICIAQSELDEFIKMEHAVYLADTLPNAKLKVLEGVSHFAPLQNPELFANEIINFFNEILLI